MRRKLISFDGNCPLNCKHCYAHELNVNSSIQDKDQVEKLVEGLNDEEDFDIVYISRRRENFIDQEAGMSLAEKIYDRYKKHIFIITRANLNGETIERLAVLSNRMREEGHLLAVAVSIAANQSYQVIEDAQIISNPDERCQVLKKLHEAHVSTLLMARPILPNRYVNTREITAIITQTHNIVDAVVSSGIAVNKEILERLKICEEELSYLPGNDAEYLIGSDAKGIKYVDVRAELHLIEEECKKLSIPFFDHSVEAIEYLLRNRLQCLQPA